MHPPPQFKTPSVVLDSVIATDQLYRRPVSRPPDHAGENRALVALAAQLGSSPDGMLRQLAETSLTLCRAHSAGISVLDEHEDAKVFRWPAIVGEWAPHVGGTTPRDFSPCGVVVDRRSPQLFVDFDRYYPYFEAVVRPSHEALLVPFFVDGEAIGTVWVVSHDATRQFDAEDLRLLSSVAKFASASFGLLASVEKRRLAELYKSELLAQVAHELRGPIAPMSSSLALMRLASGDAEEVAQARDVMERQLRLLSRLVDDLVDVDRIRMGKVRLQIARTEVAEVIRAAVETSWPMIKARGHQLALELPTSPILVDADAMRLAQVFSNLLSNAAKYSEPNGRIRVSVELRGEEILVAVKDDGAGISTLMLPKVFDLFTQADRSLENAQGGLGVGLHLVKQLVELHGGSVAARSDGEGRGSEFVVSLPVARPLEQEIPFAGEHAGHHTAAIQ